MTAVGVDAIVPVYGHWPMVERCIASLVSQTPPARVIVVDDCSPDDTADRVAERFPEVRLIRLSVNSGFAHACNAGFSAGDGDVVVLVNSDVEAEPGLLERLAASFADPAVASASPVITRPDGMLDAVGICADLTLAGYVRYHGAGPEAAGRRAPTLLGPYGAVAAYRRSAMLDDRLFDEGIFMYGEELDLALRLRGEGWGSVVVPEARAVHLGGVSTGKGSSRQLYLAGYGRGYLLGKYRILRSRHAARALLTELIVVALRLARTHDPAAARGRLDGYRAGRRVQAVVPPTSGIETRIGFLESLRMRSPEYWQRH